MHRRISPRRNPPWEGFGDALHLRGFRLEISVFLLTIGRKYCIIIPKRATYAVVQTDIACVVRTCVSPVSENRQDIGSRVFAGGGF